MSKFDLYSYLNNEGHKLSKEELQRIGAELVYTIYSYNKADYQAIMDEAIDNINESLGLGLPYENETAERYNGWSNRDTWLVALWLNNDERNYRLMIEQYEGGYGVRWDDTAQFNYGDEINFNKVNIAEIDEMIKEAVYGYIPLHIEGERGE